MAGFKEALIGAIAGGVATAAVGYGLGAGKWFTGVISDKVEAQLTATVFERLELYTKQSEKKRQDVTFRCDVDSKMVGASCVGDNGTPQAAVGPVMNADGSASCYRYGPVVMDVQGTATCLRVKH